MPISEAPFEVIVSDPPWDFDDKLRQDKVKRSGDDLYEGVMSLEQIAGLLRNSRIRAKDSILALWTPSSMFPDGFYVMREWGYTFKQIYTWVKTTKNGHLTMGMGHSFRGTTEHALIGVRGHPKRLNKGQRNVEIDPCLPEDWLGTPVDLAQVGGHSVKPETLQNRLDLMYGGSKFEMFARRDRPDWTCIGNENPSTKGIDIRDWLAIINDSLLEEKTCRQTA